MGYVIWQLGKGLAYTLGLLLVGPLWLVWKIVSLPFSLFRKVRK